MKKYDVCIRGKRIVRKLCDSNVSYLNGLPVGPEYLYPAWGQITALAAVANSSTSSNQPSSCLFIHYSFISSRS